MSWSIDGKDLSNLAWNVKNRSAGWTVPGRTGENIRVPGRHGSFYVPNKTYDEGHITLSMWANGSNEDGLLPLNEDGRRKVRENLDRLTSMFASNNRLLSLRQMTGDGRAMVNEISNPNLTTTSNTGQNLAVDGLKDGAAITSTPTEIARDIFPNPYLKGRTSTEIAITEDIYPDPMHWEYAKAAPWNLLRNYYYPVQQKEPFFNPHFLPSNNFYWKTGYASRGIIARPAAVTWATRAYLGEVFIKTYSIMPNKIMFGMHIRLGGGSNVSTIQLKITPQASNDGVTWTPGTPSTHTVGGGAASGDGVFITVSGNDLPTLATTGNLYYVKYTLELPNPSSWKAGAAFEIFRTYVQEAPLPGNPWLGFETRDLLITGGTTNYVEYSATPEKSWSVLKRALNAYWIPVNTGSKTTTTAYAYAWGQTAKYGTGPQEPHLMFAGRGGGSRQTFRRSLPAPTINTSSARIWGRSSHTTNKTTVLRVMRKIGAGEYTTVSTVSVNRANANFASPTFDLVAGGDYIMEIDTPACESGFQPSFMLRELHVSNGFVGTSFKEGESSKVWGSNRAYYTGARYKSTIIGMAYGVKGMVKGLPHHYYTTNNAPLTGKSWAESPSEAFTQDGELITDKLTFPTTIDPKTLTFRANVRLYRHTFIPADLGTVPTSLTISLAITLFNSAGAVTRTVTQNLTGVTNQRAEVAHTIALNTGEVAASAKLTVDNTANPFLGLIAERLQLMVNLPNGVTSFTGSEVAASPTWPKISSWAGTPYQSGSILSAPLSPQWSYEVFVGFDPNGAVSFTGTKVRVKANLSSGNTYFGFRRGVYVGIQTITVQPEGAATATSLGTTTSSKDFVQGFATVPMGGSTYVDFFVTGAGSYKTVRDAFAMDEWSPAFPVPSDSWVGFSLSTPPAFGLPIHPTSQLAPTTAVRRSDGTTAFTTGKVTGWNGPVLGGGYIPVPVGGTSINVSSNSVQVDGGFASAAVRIQPLTSAATRIIVEIQGATVAGQLSNTWSTLGTVTLATASYQELKIIDAAVGSNKFIRLNIRATNTDSVVTRNGILAIVDGATLTPSKTLLSGNFPGYFSGVRGPDGTSTYLGNIRQCLVEVTEAIDMESTGLGTIAEFSVNLTVPNSFWEDVYDTTTTVTAPAGSTSGAFYVADFGGATAPMMDLMMEITPVSGSLTEFKMLDKGSGQVFSYKGPEQSKIVINNDLFTVADSGSASLIQYIADAGTAALMPITPYWRGEFESLGNHVDGTPVIEWTSKVPLKIKITGRRKFLIA